MEFSFNFKKFYDFIASKNFKRMVELGVWRGDSVAYLASQMKCQFKIYAIDLFDDTYDPSILKCAENDTISKIRLIFKENVKAYSNNIIDIKGISWEIASCFDDESIDFVFIDACHEYESVKKDIEAWKYKVRKGGIISGHDYSKRWPGVKQAVNENFTDLEFSSGSVWFKQL